MSTARKSLRNLSKVPEDTASDVSSSPTKRTNARKSLRSSAVSILDDDLMQTQPLADSRSSLQTRSSGSSLDSTLPQPGCSTGANDATRRNTRASTSFLDSSTPSTSKGRFTARRKAMNSDDSDASDSEETARSKKSRQVTFSSSDDDTPVASSSNKSLKQLSRKKERDSLQKKQADKRSAVLSQAKNASRVANPETLAGKCVSYILIADQKNTSIKKTDILKHVFEGRDTKQYPTVFEEARRTLLEVFGFKLKEVKKNEYFLANALDRKLGIHEFTELSSADLHCHGFVLYILTMIFMNGNRLEEDKLWECLKPLGIDIKSRTPHPSFGDVKKFVTDVLVRQLYVERTLVCRDPEGFELSWGPRAQAELSKKDCLQFACSVLGTHPEDWIVQHNDAKSNEEETPMEED